MTVKQLIEALTDYDDDTQVIIGSRPYAGIVTRVVGDKVACILTKRATQDEEQLREEAIAPHRDLRR